MWSLFKKKEKIEIPNRSLVSVRMEAIGGQGANSAGKILAEAAVLGMGYTGNHFSSFGSEKRGSPVKSYVRFSTEKKPIRTASSIKHPDVLVIFHESLLQSHPEVFEGSTDDTFVLINSRKKPDEINFPVDFIARQIATLDASQIANDTKSGLNSVILGAMSNLVSEIDAEKIEYYFTKFFAHLSEAAIHSNLKAFKEGLESVKFKNFSKEQAVIKREATEILPDMGWANSPLGGVIINPGNTVLKDHSASRKGVAPQLLKEICFNCGFCDMVCPDYCFVWKTQTNEKGEKVATLQGIDYQYCKGCQKCITVCPVEALRPIKEEELTAEDLSFHLFPEQTHAQIQKKWKEKSWAHYIENLSENERMSTIQTELLDSHSYLRPDFKDEEIDTLLTEEMKKKFSELKK